MPSTSIAQSSRHRRRLRRTLLVALAAAAALTATTGAAAEEGGGSPAPLRDKQLFIAVGKGEVTGEVPFCFNGVPGPCGWFVQGTHNGRPISSGTFHAAIDDGNAASPRRCAPATYSALLYDSPTDEISHVAEGQVCPNGAGGYVFTGRFDSAGGTGRFRDVSSGSGRLRVTLAANGSATLTFAGHLRIG